MIRRKANALLIVDGEVKANHLAANSVTAGSISVTSLDTVSTILGTVNISNAIIGTLTVLTPNIGTNAVTKNFSAFTAGGTNVSSSTYVTLASVSVTSESGDIINVFVSGDYNESFSTTTAESASVITYRIYRDATVLTTFTGFSYANYGSGGSSDSVQSAGSLSRFYKYSGTATGSAEAYTLQANKTNGNASAVSVKNRGIFVTVYRR